MAIWQDKCGRRVDLVKGMLFTDYVDLYTFPLVFLVCLVGSCFIVIITCRRVRWDNAGEWYLTQAIICVLAVSDCLGTISDACIYVCQVRLNHLGAAQSLTYDYLRTIAVYSKSFCLFLSNGLLICFSIERMVSLRPSKQRMHLIHLQNVKVPAFLFLVGLVLYSTISPMPYLLDDCAWYASGNNSSSYLPVWLEQWILIQTYHDVIFIFCTCLSLAISSGVVFHLIKKRQTRRHSQEKIDLRMHISHGGGSSFSSSSSTAANRALFGCVFLYFVTQTPVMVRNILKYISDYPHCLFAISDRDAVNSQNLVVMLARLNFACNFLIYLVVDNRFRRHTKLFVLEQMGLVEDGRTRQKRKLLQQLSSTRSFRSVVSSDPVSSQSPSSPTPRFTFGDNSLESQQGGEKNYDYKHSLA